MASKRRSISPRVSGLIEALETSFQDALRCPDGSADAAVLLWTDADRQWMGLIPRLQKALPQLFVLGSFKPGERTGPSIWLRCVVDRMLPEISIPDNSIPVLYLPGVSRQALRAGEECPKELQPLVELQYRGRVWHQRNGRDWTVDAFLISEDGLALDVAQDARTREAAIRSLGLLAETPLDGLRNHRLEADDFDRLAVSDPTRDVLRWMSQGEAFRISEGDARWKSFCGVCNAEFKLDPEKGSPADAATTLVEGSGKWADVWERFKEAPKLYPGVARLLRDLPGQLHLGFDQERFPRANDEAEQRLRKELESIATLSHAQAVALVHALESEHGRRRQWVWTQLGESPLAVALEFLVRLASEAISTLGGATIDAVVRNYASDGWRCDRAALEALSAVKAPSDIALIGRVVRALYLPWVDATARHFQSLVHSGESEARALVSGTEYQKDACLLFADGLRFDVATILRDRLEAKGLRVRLSHRMAPLPTVTSTAKPFATVVNDALEGSEDIVDFNPRIRSTGQPVTAQRLRDEMTRRGLDMLGDEIRPPKPGVTGGWLETGHLDELGHKLGVRLAGQIDNEIDILTDHIMGILENGWTRIRVVTDHGWILVPGGLPKIDLPAHLAATKWSRCASLKGESKPDLPVHSWHWNIHVRIASPPGAGTFAANAEYSHGGISPQECVVPELVVERGDASTRASITAINWRGMRCRVSVTTNDPSVLVDLRLNWKQPNTSISASMKEVGPAGETSLAVADDAHEGSSASVVVLDGSGNVLDRKPTTIGEDA